MKLIKKIGIAAIVLVATSLVILAIQNPDTFAETSPAHEDERLRPQRYKTSLENFAAETEKIIPTLATYGQNWKLISSDSFNDSMLIKAEVPVLFFTDDLQVRVESVEEKGEITVNIYSSQRVGLNDWGENRRHVLQILEALDGKFSE